MGGSCSYLHEGKFAEHDLQPSLSRDDLFGDLPLKKTKKKKGVQFAKGSTTPAEKNGKMKKLKTPKDQFIPLFSAEDILSNPGGMEILDTDLESSSNSDSESSSDSSESSRFSPVTFSSNEQESFLHWRFHTFCSWDRLEYMNHAKCLEWISIVNKLVLKKERQLNCRKILETYGYGPEDNRILRIDGFVKYYMNMKSANEARFLTELQRLGMKESLMHYDRRYIANLSEPIGRGAFGSVYFGLSTDKAKCKANKQVAIKVIQMNWRNPELTKRVVRELRILRKISSNDNVITLMDVKIGEMENIRNFEHIHLISNYMTVDLDKHLKDQDMTYTIDEVRSIMKQLLQGLQYLHSCQVVHRDLKPQNILITRMKSGEFDCKICDFGLARSFDENHKRPHLLFQDEESESSSPRLKKPTRMRLENTVSTHVVTRYWRAPEVSLKVQERTNITGIDIWAAGCIFAEVLQMVESVRFYKLGDLVGPTTIAQIQHRNGRVECGLLKGYGRNAELQWEPRENIGADPARRELFKGGADTMLSGSEISGNSEDDQLVCIAINLGRPPEHFLQHAHPNLRDRLKRFSKNPMVLLENSLTAPKDAIHLLKEMLTWDPSYRIDAGTALLEPFFFDDLQAMKSLTSHDIARNNLMPPSTDPSFVRSMSNFEDVKLERGMWKKLVLDEIYFHNPELTDFEPRESVLR